MTNSVIIMHMWYVHTVCVCADIENQLVRGGGSRGWTNSDEKRRNECGDKDVVQYKYLRPQGECISFRVPLKRRHKEPKTREANRERLRYNQHR